MGVIQHAKTSTISDDGGTVNTYMVQPSDWNSSHAYTLQDAFSILTAGNDGGTIANISSGTCYLAGGNNIILSQNASSITISGRNIGTLSMWPDDLPGSTAVSTYYSGSTGTVGGTATSGYTFSIYFAPFALESPVAFSAIKLPVSNSHVNSVGTVTQIYSIGFYTNNVSTLSKINDAYAGLFLSQSSNSSATYSIWTCSTGSNAAGGVGGFGGLSVVSIYSSNTNTTYVNGPRNMSFSMPSTTFTEGHYWMALAFCSVSATAGSNAYSNVGIFQPAGPSSTQIRDFAEATAAGKVLENFLGWGAISTTFTSNTNGASWFPLPTNVAVSNMTTTATSAQRFHAPILLGI